MEKQINRTGEANGTMLSNGEQKSNRQSNELQAIGGKKGMILPFLPLSIAFDNIRYSVDMPQVILHKQLSNSTCSLVHIMKQD